MSNQYRILLVGAGNMGSLHARVTSQHPRTSLDVLVDPREDVGRSVAERFGATWRAEIGDLTQIDAVIIAAATEAHEELAVQVLEAGKPLLIEKPVAPSLKATMRIVDLAEVKDLPLQCGLLERYNPAVVTARRAIREPVYVTAKRHSPYAPRIATGVASDLLVHDVDLAIQVMGAKPARVNASLGVFDPRSLAHAEDIAEVQMVFDNSAIAQVSASRVGQRKIRELFVHELDRLFEIDLLRRTVTIYHHISGEAADDNGRGYRQQSVMEIPELVTSQEPLGAQLDHFVEILDGEGDAAEERRSILPAHEVIDLAKAARNL